jgi:hypothetical protein
MIKYVNEPKSETIIYVKCDKCVNGIYFEDAGEGAGVGIPCPYCRGKGKVMKGIEC